LRTTKRFILTNLPVEFEALRAGVIERFGEDYDLRKRLVVLTSAQAARFWEYYGQTADSPKYTPPEELTGRDLKQNPDGLWEWTPLRIKERIEIFDTATDGKQGEPVRHLDYAERGDNHPGCLVIIDECQVFWNSRKWARNGEDCTYYISQERKLGDDQVLMTQNIDLVDKQLRVMGQEYVVCINHRKNKFGMFGGIFRAPAIFTRHHYLQLPKGMEEPIESRTFTLDKDGVASWYRTAAGVGIVASVDSEADKGKKQGGLSLVWLVPLAALFVWGVFAVSAKAPALFTSAVSGKEPVNKTVAGVVPSPVVAHKKVTNDYNFSPVPGVVTAGFAEPVHVKAAPVVEEVFLTGVWQDLHKPGERIVMWAMLSDGRQYRAGDSHFTDVGRGLGGVISTVRIDGKVFRFRPSAWKSEK
jgi:hypothetical protein